VLLLPDLTVSSNGRVTSILLVSKVPVQKLAARPVALANTSATSQVLARIILKEQYHLTPRYFECPPDLPEMLREADAGLLIGDDALRVWVRQPKELYIYDLGEAWKKLTGEAMVYAVWAVRKTYAAKHPELVSAVFHAFKNSMRLSLENIDEIARDISRWEQFSVKFLKEYFKTLRFDFGQEYQRGLLRYYSMAKKVGAIDKVPQLKFVEMD
jgi:chorismate dehydratase